MAEPGQHWTVGPGEAGWRLDKYLADAGRLASRSRASSALERRKIFVNDREATVEDASLRLSAGDRVRYWADRPGSARAAVTTTGALAIVYEDAALIVVNKPPGLLTVPLERRAGASSVQEQLRDYLRRQHRRAFVVHRIDRDTSGLVMFAKSEAIQAELKGQFRRREPERLYWAVVYGHPSPSQGTWSDHLVWDDRALIQKETHPGDPRAAAAESHYRVIERFAATALIEVSLVSGKRNQIRIQARLRGHTLVGEQRYTYGPSDLRPIRFARQALHARRLRFLHPVDGHEIVVEAEPPDDLSRLLASLRQR